MLMPATNNCVPKYSLPMQYLSNEKPQLRVCAEYTMELVNAHPILKSFLVGSFSGTCSALLFQPLDLLKTRLQNTSSPGYKNRGLFSLLYSVVKNERVVGLWKGTVPSIVRCVPGVGMYFCSLHWIQSVSGKQDPTPLEAVCLGVLARSFAGVTLLPVTVIKTRFESGVYSYGSITQALRVIYTTEGARGLFSGLIPTLFRDAPFSGLYLLFYSQCKKKVPSEWREGKKQIPVHFSCGIVSGLLASVITQPPDVIKTKMQLYPKKFHNLSTVIIFIHKKYGPLGFFKGMLPRMLRRTLMAAMAWTVYEQIMRGVGIK